MVDSIVVVGPDWLRKQLESASPDLLREMVGNFIAALMGAEADAVCGAPYGESSAERVNSRNGYRHREFDTRVSRVGWVRDSEPPVISRCIRLSLEPG